MLEVGCHSPWISPRLKQEGFSKRVRSAVSEELFPALSTMLATIEQPTQEIRSMDREVERLCQFRSKRRRDLMAKGVKASADKVIKDIRRRTCRRFSAEEKIRVVP